LKSFLKPLGEQVMVITGASSGIGLLIAHSAASHGAKVFLIARNGEALARIVRDIGARGGIAAFSVADVGDACAIDAAADRAVECFGRIDSWINNAGVAIYAPLLDTPDDEHARLFSTNYFGTVHGCRAAVRHMRATGGALITVASIASDMASPILGAYAASKHAVKAYVRSLRIELRAQGAPIAVTLIKPSGMATPIGMHAANHLDGEALVPPPAYDPQLVADTVLFCAQHYRREVTVGGIGRAQALLASHCPTLFERLAPLVIPLLSTKKRPRTMLHALEVPQSDGHARSPHETGLAASPYTSLILRPRLGALLGLTLSGVALALFQAVRRS
jgi:NAD(P)-dependent dehydrogenase (short-subunit alcohol dehydrogenase family)